MSECTCHISSPCGYCTEGGRSICGYCNDNFATDTPINKRLPNELDPESEFVHKCCEDKARTEALAGIQQMVATALGYKDIGIRSRYNGIQDVDVLCGDKDGICYQIPDYPNDLQACAEMRAWLDGQGNQVIYGLALHKIVSRDCTGYLKDGFWLVADATAIQHCEAFLVTIGVW